jgi:hypothetical protein
MISLYHKIMSIPVEDHAMNSMESLFYWTLIYNNHQIVPDKAI